MVMDVLAIRILVHMQHLLINLLFGAKPNGLAYTPAGWDVMSNT